MELAQLVEDKINECAAKIVKGGSATDEVSFGKLAFFLALRRVQQKKATAEDVGLLDAINDTLQALGVVDKGKTFYKDPWANPTN
ncbi:hypothetical protein [Paraburkholderia phenazinium]|jgi:hypothetical protein|uniref:Uncharacterized protein n=1 Tax=Paraburkholderia phenazinium TaxID=60549 RepID=A0A1N6HZJ4_9BURK|nr:hypothetical protein [Paraburkholderia phenazinium]SIO25196.1 hypothetical protein SAMN05444165_1702 [Paraburkholderia phenazinium]